MRTDKKINSINDLEIADGIFKIDTLTLSILATLSNLKDLDSYYEMYKDVINDESNIRHAFYELKQYIRLRFYCQMRDYSDMTYQLFKKDEYKCVKELIPSMPFMREFIGRDAYTALSVCLHNLNELLFSEEKIISSMNIDEKMNDIINMSLNDIKKEFETINFELKKCEIPTTRDMKYLINNSFPLFSFIKELLKNQKNKN